MRTSSIALSVVVALAGGCALDEGTETDGAEIASDELALETAAVGTAATAYRVVLSKDGGYNSSFHMTTPLGTVTCSGSACDYLVPATYTVTVTISPTFDFVHCEDFSHWEGSCAGGVSTCSFVVDGDEQAHAVFVPTAYMPNGQPCMPL